MLRASMPHYMWDPLTDHNRLVLLSEVTESELLLFSLDGNHEWTLTRAVGEALLLAGAERYLTGGVSSGSIDTVLLKWVSEHADELRRELPERLGAAVRDVLTPDLLSPAWRRRYRPGDDPTTGHCYVAAETAYWLFGGPPSGWKPRVARTLDARGESCTHWWIEHPDAGRCDPTAAQFYSRGAQPPYGDARGIGFLTAQPSKRSQTVLSRLLQPKPKGEENEIPHEMETSNGA